MSQQEVTVQSTKQPTADEYTRAGRTFRPNVDIMETDECLYLWADMPGVDEKAVAVELSNDILTIEGRVGTEEYQNLTPLYTEYHVGNFAHRFRLSTAIAGDKIDARMRNGVLELKLPKVEEAKPRRIEISG